MQRNTLNGIRRQIAELTLEGVNILDIMQELTSTDWNSWITEAREREWPISFCRVCHHNFLPTIVDDHKTRDICENCDEAYKKTVVRSCKRCEQPLTREYILSKSEHLPINFPCEREGHYARMLADKDYCTECLNQVIQECSIQCADCKSNYIPFNHRLFCDICLTEDNLQEAVRVVTHNTRARELNLPATLTVKQWLGALKHFNWLCAYCDSPYKTLEHYLPLSLNGGTTQDNCLPACNRCNLIKRNKHPDHFIPLFPPVNITRIRGYFEQVRMEVAV